MRKETPSCNLQAIYRDRCKQLEEAHQSFNSSLGITFSQSLQYIGQISSHQERLHQTKAYHGHTTCSSKIVEAMHIGNATGPN